MDRERAKYLAPFLAAYGNGSDVQCRACRGPWIDMDCPDWTADEYRVKPAKPRVCWYSQWAPTNDSRVPNSIELTDAVKEALEAAGIPWEESDAL